MNNVDNVSRVSNAELFATLNAARVVAGMSPLTANKLSRASLEAAIAKLGDAATINSNAKRDRAAKRANDAAHKPSPNVAADVAAPSTADTFTLAKLARELGISPKIVRAKARRNAAKLAPLMTAEKHVYRMADRAAIVAFIMAGRAAS